MSIQETCAMRKLCFTGPYLHRLVRGAPTAVTHAPNEPFATPTAVLLLNSPSSTADDFEEYLALWERAQQGQQCEEAQRPSESADKRKQRTHPCTFMCGDGAYAALLRYCDGLSDVDTTVPLCDVLIGDMDSIDTQTWARAAGAEVAVPSMPTSNDEHDKVAPGTCQSAASTRHTPSPALFDFDGHRHASVSTLPDEVIAKLHRRIHDRRAERPIALPVACQMTTDFQKCLLLLQRLQRVHADDVPSYSTAPPHNEQESTESATKMQEDARQLLALADQLSRGSAAHYAAELTDTAEVDRCASLLSACTSPSCATRLSSVTDAPPAHVSQCSVVLPTVLALGALGGRLDHEFASFCTLSLFARSLNIVLLNAHNIVAACWPDGLTQWIPGLVAWSTEAEAVPAHPQRSMCGIIPLGKVVEMETTGLLYDIVKGRTPPRYDGYTQNSHYNFSFDGIVSTSNQVVQHIVTIDLRPIVSTRESAGSPQTGTTDEAATRTKANDETDPLVALFNRNASTVNPPTLLTCQRASRA